MLFRNVSALILAAIVLTFNVDAVTIQQKGSDWKRGEIQSNWKYTVANWDGFPLDASAIGRPSVTDRDLRLFFSFVVAAHNSPLRAEK